jgi:hypothetical protein
MRVAGCWAGFCKRLGLKVRQRLLTGMITGLLRGSADRSAMPPQLESTRWIMRGKKVLHCLLMLCLWQGPLPVWHAHGTLVDAPEGSRPWLADHLQTHHASVDPCELVFFGWHVHFEVPACEDEPEDAPSASLRCPAVMSAGVDGVRPLARVGLPVAEATIQPVLLLVPLRQQGQARWARRGFFPDDAASLPLPLRIGVVRC